MNQWNSKSSDFFKKYKKNAHASLIEFEGESDIENPSNRSESLLKGPSGYFDLNKFIDEPKEYVERGDGPTVLDYIKGEYEASYKTGVFPTDAQVLEAYWRYGSMRKASAVCKIPLSTIFDWIHAASANMKNKMKTGDL